jgi:hypothetical protein
MAFDFISKVKEVAITADCFPFHFSRAGYTLMQIGMAYGACSWLTKSPKFLDAQSCQDFFGHWRFSRREG